MTRSKVTTAWKPLKRSRPSVPHGTNFAFVFWLGFSETCHEPRASSKLTYSIKVWKQLLEAFIDILHYHWLLSDMKWLWTVQWLCSFCAIDSDDMHVVLYIECSDIDVANTLVQLKRSAESRRRPLGCRNGSANGSSRSPSPPEFGTDYDRSFLRLKLRFI